MRRGRKVAGAVAPRCRHCGARVWKTGTGVCCDDCTSRVVPVPLYEAQSFLPLDWGAVDEIKSQIVYRSTSECRESLTAQNRRLRAYGLRQPSLFAE